MKAAKAGGELPLLYTGPKLGFKRVSRFCNSTSSQDFLKVFEPFPSERENKVSG